MLFVSLKKDLIQFKQNYKKYKSPGIRYTNLCLSCDKQIYKEWRLKNREYYNGKFRERRLARKLRAIAFKGGCCQHCGLVVHPAAFDFHHLDKTKKDIDPGLMMTSSDEKLFLELEKCILLCSNCHRTEHFVNGY